MATNFSPCKGSYVLNQFLGNVMFGMNGFHVSASGAIQGHHGPLVVFCSYVQLVTPRAGPVLTQGHFMNKLCRGLQGDATYKISKL